RPQNAFRAGCRQTKFTPFILGRLLGWGSPGDWALPAILPPTAHFMVNRNLIRSLDIDDEELDADLAALNEIDPSEIGWTGQDVTLNQIVDGRILRVEGDLVLVDVGYKSEGTIPLNEWDEDEEPPQPGQVIKVLIEEMEDATAMLDEGGMISLSKRKAEKIRKWIEVMEKV